MVRAKNHNSKTVKNFGIKRCTFFKEEKISYNISKNGLKRIIFSFLRIFLKLDFDFVFFVDFLKLIGS